MTKVLQGLVFRQVLIYIDDLLVFGRTDEDLLRAMAAVFDRLRKHGIFLKHRKCELFTPSLV